MLKNGTYAYPATTLARRVLPVPGGPTRSTPLALNMVFFSYYFVMVPIVHIFCSEVHRN
jgi:hypothetical protein